MRVYIPGILSDLIDCTSGQWQPGSGFAVTEAVLDAVDHDDAELLDEQIRDTAAHASVTVHGSARRVVIVADLAPSEVQVVGGTHAGAVTITGKVTADAIACGFVDEPEAEDDGALAAQGDAAALERLEQRDLLWYDASELAFVV